MLRVTCDTTVALDGLNGTRLAAVELLMIARAGGIDVAFATRLRSELRSFTLEELEELLGQAPRLLPSSWRLDYGMLGIDTYLGGAPEDISTPTMESVGKLQALDSDHLEAHRRDGRDVFVTSDAQLLKAARERGFDAVTPEELVARLRAP